MPTNGPPLRRLAALVALLFPLALAGCGDDGEGASTDREAGSTRDATLVLDFVPGPVHAGVYRALEAGYYEDAGIDLRVIEPTSTADTLKLIDSGKADFGLADGIDVATQIDMERGAKAVMAIARRPLGGLITRVEDGFESPADLGSVGVTGVPSDQALVETEIADAGGDPDEVELVTIGFNGVQALENGKIDAFTGFVPADGIQVEVDGHPTRSFPIDEHGGPSYPGLVAFSTEDAIAADPQLTADFVAATTRGYEGVLADPAVGLDALLAANPAIPAEFAKASLEAYMPYLDPAGAPFGTIEAAQVEELSRFLVDNGLIDAPIAPERYALDPGQGS